MELQSSKVKQATGSKHISGLNAGSYSNNFCGLKQICLVSNNLKELQKEIEVVDKKISIYETGKGYLFCTPDNSADYDYSYKKYKYYATFYVLE